MIPNAENIRTRILEKVIRVNNHWIMPKKNTGYSEMHANGQSWLGHRLSYEAFVGPIPSGLQIDHLCKVTNCVNPEHLEPVTRQENHRRSNSVSGINARKTHCKRKHPLSGDNIRIDRGTRQCKKCNALREAQRRERNRLGSTVAQPTC